MKIGILTPSIYMYKKRYKERIFAPGELARHLVAGLVSQGHDVTWITAPGEETKARMIEGNVDLLEKDLEMRKFQDINEGVIAKVSLVGTKMYYEMDLLTRAYKAAQKGEIELLHVFHSFGYLANFFSELTRVPALFTIHDPLPTSGMLESWLLTRFPEPRYISISRRQQGDMGKHFIGNVYNGIDSHEFAFSPNCGSGFITVGRLVSQKGFDQAIEAIKIAHEKLTMATWVTDNVKESDYYKQKIVPQVDGKDIVIENLMQEEKRVQFYQNAKALLFPIAWEEPFGLVMTEAMSCGTPVIAYNRGSVAEVVKDGVTGFIIEPDDTDRPGKGNWLIRKTGIEGLVEAMKRIGEIDRAACRRHVEENFTIEKMVEGYEKIYQEALASKSRA